MILAEKIVNCLSENSPFTFDIHDTLVSTNITAKELAKNGAPAYTVVIADSQTGGHGRFDRAFFSPAEAGIYMSIILRPNLSIEKASEITPFAAVCVADAIEKLSGGRVGIKWVNDLFLNGKKICGILVESAVSHNLDKLSYAVVGIGINVLAADIPENLMGVITSVESETGVKLDRNRLIAEILNRFSDFENDIAGKNYLSTYRARSVLLGKTVKIIRADETFSAVAKHINDDGTLTVVTEDGQTVILNSGEVSIKL